MRISHCSALSNGLSPQDEDGHSALDLARLAEHEEIVALLA